MGKLICMGDCIADMLPDGAGSLTYTAKMGGAPANVCVAAAKLGVRACFLGKLADDAFGRFLLAELKSYGVDTSLTVVDKACKTGLAFVALSSDGDREFFFYRDTPADASLSPDEVTEDMFASEDVLHFCSISLKPSPTRDAIEKAAELARAAGATVSFDVNLRLNLWDNDEAALRKTVFDFFPLADIVKVTDEELLFLTGTDDEKAGVQRVFASATNAKLVFVTKGAAGASVWAPGLAHRDYAAVPRKAVDTTGAGDCFVGGIVYNILSGGFPYTVEGADEAVKFALSACAYAISEKGAATAMPTLPQVLELKRSNYGDR